MYLPAACLSLFSQIVTLASWGNTGALGLGHLHSLQFNQLRFQLLILPFQSCNTSLQLLLLIRQKEWVLVSASLPSGVQYFLQSWLSVTTLLGLSWQSLLRWVVFPHYQNTGHPSLQCSAGGGCVPTGTLVAPLIVSLTGVPAATFAAPSLMTWLRVSWVTYEEVLLHFSISHSIDNAWAVSLWMKSTCNPTRAQCTNHLT
jgi:hypothetical protein